MTPIWHPSPNFGERRGGLRPDLIVLHYTAMDTAKAALDRLCDPAVEVSAHYLIGADGTVWQMVAEAARAWHAGAGEWCGLGDVNSRSIGIELDNRGDHPFSEPQMTALEGLLAGVMVRWDMSADAVIGHSDMAPGRKSDPGPHFDWQRLERLGLAERPGCDERPASVSMTVFKGLAVGIGYTAGVDDEALLQAVRLRFRPWATGPLTAKDIGCLLA